ncbi:hypothetical protein NC652_041670 [Populus alba x Populus x berolinensis]|nr:hypothetical protein NC652_041670 [Populus alba x Populus x berolinensis]
MGRNSDKLSKLGEHNHRTYQYKFIWHRIHRQSVSHL